MAQMTRHIGRSLLLLVALLILSTATTGCEWFPESTFELASGSRLPRWFHLTPELARSDVSVTMNYYVPLWGNNVTFILHDKKGHVLSKVAGKTSDIRPLDGSDSPQSGPVSYPSFAKITVNGVTETVEHKRMEPIFYVVDDLRLGQNRCTFDEREGRSSALRDTPQRPSPAFTSDCGTRDRPAKNDLAQGLAIP